MKWLNIVGAVVVFGAALSLSPAAEARTGRHPPVPSFRQLDRNNDGRIGAFEYRRDVSQRFARWMRRVDWDRDGYLTRKEKARARRTSPVAWSGRLARRGPVPLWSLWATYMDRARADFRRLDRDRSGFVSRAEYRRGHRGRRPAVDRRGPAKGPRRGLDARRPG